MALALGALIGEFAAIILIGLMFLFDAVVFMALWNWIIPAFAISLFEAFVGVLLVSLVIRIKR